MDTNCRKFASGGGAENGVLMKGPYEMGEGKGSSRTFYWPKIQKEFTSKGKFIAKYAEEAEKDQRIITDGEYFCANAKYAQAPYDYSAFMSSLYNLKSQPTNIDKCKMYQAYCTRELKNKGLIDQLSTWKTRMDNCINNPIIKYKGSRVRYKSAYGKNCEYEKVNGNVKYLLNLKTWFDEEYDKLPANAQKLWNDVSNRYKDFENDFKALEKAKIAADNKALEDKQRAAAKKKIDDILDGCKQHFNVDLGGCGVSEDPKVISDKSDFKSSIKELKKLADSNKVVTDVASKDIQKLINARLYAAVVSGEAKQNKEELNKALCSIKSKKQYRKSSRYDPKLDKMVPASFQRFDICDAKYKSSRDQAV